MNYCSTCGKPLEESAKFCPSCGAAQPSKEALALPRSEKLPAAIIILSVFTLLGSSFGMIRGLFYQTFANFFESTSVYNESYSRGYILVLLNLGTLVAAILMLNYKRAGFYLYLLFQSGYLAFTFYITLIYSNYEDATTMNISNGLNPLVILIGSFFWFPSTLLLILHLTLVRKYFRKPAR